MKPSCLGLIPARGNSKGVPGKNSRLLAGRPLVEYTLAAALQSKRLQRTIVSTDSQPIANLVRRSGAEVPFLRPPELSRDNTPTLPVVEHALRFLAEEQNYHPDIVVLLQPTSPLRTSHHIDEAIERLIASDADALVSVVAAPRHFSPHWQFRLQGDQLQLCDGRPLSQIIPRRQELPTTYVRNGAIYAFRREPFLALRSFFGERCAPYLMSEADSVNIDTFDDWRRAEEALSKGRVCHEAG